MALAFHIAQLRHLYTHLLRLGHEGYADGLLSPAVKELEKVQEMRLCEANRVFLKPDTIYTFTVDPKCRACREAAERAGVTNYAATPVQTPEEELSDIADMLQAWLADNTEHVFEEEPEVDQARSLLLERCGDL